jgi:hypothetical protein
VLAPGWLATSRECVTAPVPGFCFDRSGAPVSTGRGTYGPRTLLMVHSLPHSDVNRLPPSPMRLGAWGIPSGAVPSLPGFSRFVYFSPTLRATTLVSFSAKPYCPEIGCAHYSGVYGL